LTTGVIYPKDYALVNLTLLTGVATFDMKTLMVELSYHEDIFNNTASGYLTVTDSMGYIETLSLTGNEFIRMTFGKTSNDGNWIDKLFRVYKVDKRKLENNMNTETYSLYFCSEEVLLSEQYKLSKAYPNQSISENVTDILKNVLKVPDKKIAVIEPTYGVYSFVVPTIKPFDAINWMSTYARPTADKPGSDMLFYEDKFGFNFRSIQSLLLNPLYKTYSYDPKNLASQDINKKLNNVTTYEILDSYDALKGINSGIFANELISANPLTRKKTVTKFNYFEYISKSKKLNEYPISNNFQNRFGDTVGDTSQAVLKLVFSNFDQNSDPYIASQPAGGSSRDVFAETYIPYRTAQLSLANYTRMKISLPGDPGLTVGQTICFNLLSRKPNVKELDKYYSGNYLITAVRHLINFSEYKTILEITKESTTTPYASADNNSALWKNTVKGNI
jgi:hypothetical protein